MTTSVSIDEKELLELLRGLIKIESVNPDLVKGGGGESEIARHIGRIMTEAGLGVEYQEAGPGRLNVIGRLKGVGEGKSLMLNGHTDTVSTGGMDIEPLVPEFRGGRVYGRGSLDMKGGLAAMIMAVKAVVRAGVRLKGDVLLAFVADEEYASIGTEELVKKYSADAAIICEPTNLEIGIAHKGFAWTRVDVFGRAAHGSRPGEGIDAIVKAGKLLVEIEKMGNTTLAGKSHRLLGPPSIHASLISGGTELSTYPSHCRIDLERRTIPGETRETVREEMKCMIDGISGGDEQFRADFDVFFYRPPLEVPESELIVQSLAGACRRILNRTPGFIGFSGWMDSAILAESGIPTAIFGPGGEGLHASVEYVDFDTVVCAAKVLASVITEFCSQ